MRYRPELDGLRGVAVLLVVMSHAGVPGINWGGQIGVTLFFVLSGYLITNLLVVELGHSGRISLVDFYWRRGRRLFPALALLLAVSVIVGWATLPQTAVVVFYVGNWVVAEGYSLGWLGHTWTLAIEEQFYLVWPIVFAMGLRSPRVLLALALGSAVFRLADGTEWGWYSTIGRADALLVGCALALTAWRLPRAMLVVGFGLVLAASMLPMSVWVGYSIGIPIAIIGSATAITAARPGLLSIRPLVFIGSISYAWYLWHFPLVLGTDWPALVTVPLSFALACASTRLVEAPFRRLARPSLKSRMREEPAS